MGNVSVAWRRSVCSGIGVECAAEVESLAAMVRVPDGTSSAADKIDVLRALSTLSVCIPQHFHLPALQVALKHPLHHIRAAAASSISSMISDIETTSVLSGTVIDSHSSKLLASALLDHGLLLLLMKSSRVDAEATAAITALRPYLDDYAQDYLIAAQHMLAMQNARDCRSLLKAGVDASSHQSSAALLAWAHTRSAQHCPVPQHELAVLSPCTLPTSHQAIEVLDPCVDLYVAYHDCNVHAQTNLKLAPDRASIACQAAEAAARRCDYSRIGYCHTDEMSEQSFSVIKRSRTAAGFIFYHAHDLYFRISLEMYGEWAQSEVEFMMRFLPPGATVIDAGAHVGSMSLALARQLGPSSTIIAIEANRFFASLARANSVSAGMSNIHVIHAALSNSSGCHMARADYASFNGIANLGGIGVVPCPERVRRACATRNCAFHGETHFDGIGIYEWVPTLQIDDLGLMRCDVLKMDVEAMEGAVALGARRTISTFKPMVYYEDNGRSVIRDDSTSPSFMEEMGYKCYSRAEPLWRKENWKGNSRDVFRVNGLTSQSHMLFCVHPESHAGKDSYFRE